MVHLTLVKYDDFTNSQIVNYTAKMVGAFFYSSVKYYISKICKLRYLH